MGVADPLRPPPGRPPLNRGLVHAGGPRLEQQPGGGQQRGAGRPYPPRSEQVVVRGTGQLSKRTWELHHDPSIASGGEVYDLSAIRIVTPKQHDMLGKKEMDQ